MGDEELKLSSDDVMEVVSATRRFANSLGDDTLRPAEVLPDALEPLVSQPSVPGAQTVVDVHKGAHRIVNRTLVGVKEDLRTFATNLENSVDDLEQTDMVIERILGLLVPGGNHDVHVPVNDDAMEGIGQGEGPSSADNARDEAVSEGSES